MNSKLPLFALVMLALLAETGQGESRPSASSAAAKPAPLASNRLLDQAQQALARHSSIEAKIRQQSHLFGQQLFGSGIYLQQGSGPEMLMRMELKLQVAGQGSSLLQVGDGRYLWTERQLSGQRSVERIDLRLVREKLRADSPAMPGRWPTVGGLGELLARLAANFRFAPATTGELGEVPVYTLVGTLRAERVAQKAAELDGDPQQVRSLEIDQLPEQLPGEVLVVLGRDDLFPYLIEYRRPSRAGQGGGEVLLRMQLFEVRLGGPVDLRQFVYRPGNVPLEDRTDELLHQLRRRPR